MPKDNEVDEKVPVYVATAPERIFLQVADDAYYAEDPFPIGEEVTWCADSVMALEVAYRREDLHAATVTELRADRDSWREQAEDRLREWDKLRAEVASSKLQGELAALEQFLLMASEPVGQECCGQGRYECCGNQIPVFAQPNEVFQAMSDRHAEILASLATLTGADPT